MSRYIDAEQFICELDGSECLDTERDYDEIAKRLEECETADVEEIRHGKWIFDKIGYIACSCCDFRAYAEYKHIDFDHLNNYCPNCGAKMDGE